MSIDLKKGLQEDMPGHYVAPELLCVGLYVHLDLGWMHHPFAFRNFKIKDEDQIRKIKTLNLVQIRYDPLRSDVEPDFRKPVAALPVQPEPQIPETRPTPHSTFSDPRAGIKQASRLKQLNEAILESDQAFTKNAVKVREAVRHLSEFPERSREMADNLVRDMVTSIITEGDVALHAINNRSRNEEHFVHPLNVTVLALMLARSLDMSDEAAATLGMAALFHDVGKEETPKNKSFMDLHCETGASIMQRSGFSERISEIILQHHECMDGSGFPRRLRGDETDSLARLLALVNHYENLCNPTLPSVALTPYEALSKMYVAYPEKFDTTMLKMLVRMLGIYPPGSIVQLSNGLYGIVLTSNFDKPLLPCVMVYLPKIARETPVVIDLAEDNNLEIKLSLKPEQLPREVFDYLGPRKRVSYYFLKKETVPVAQQDTANTAAKVAGPPDPGSPILAREA